MSGIYAFYSKTKPRAYIGQTAQRLFSKRKYQHLYKLRTATHENAFWQSHYCKYGEDDLEFVVLVECADTSRLADLEQQQIDNHKALGFTLFNHKQATGSQVITDEMRAKIAKANTGKKASDSTRKKLSEVHKGCKLSAYAKEVAICTLRTSAEKVSVSVSVYGNGLDGEVYPSISQAAKSLGLVPGNILRVLRGERTHTKGYQFYYQDRDTPDKLTICSRLPCAVLVTGNGLVGQLFASSVEAEKTLGLPRSKLKMVLDGKRKHTGGYTAIYANTQTTQGAEGCL